MKKLITICSALVLLNAGRARATSVEVINEQYHVWGNYWLLTGDDEIISNSYDSGLSISPVSGSAWYSEKLYGTSSTDLLYVGASSNSNEYSQEHSASGMAEGDWVFRPQEGFYTLELQLNLYPYDSITVLFEDVTIGDEMFYYSGPADYQFDDFVEIFPVDPDHNYHMHAYIESTANFDGPWSGIIQATITPEPATLALFGLGALGMIGRKR